MDSILKLLALLEKYAPLIEKYLPLLEAQLKRGVPPPPAADRPTPLVEEDIPAPKKPDPIIFFASQLDVMDVNGEPYNPVNAINWGSYVRFDSNPKDQYGKPLPAEMLSEIESLEWKHTWDGEPDRQEFAHINVGGALYQKSNGLAVSAKVFKEGEDAKRHAWAVWLTYHLKGGRTVDTNEITLMVD